MRTVANTVRWMHPDTNTSGNSDTDTGRTDANSLCWIDLGRVH